MRTSKCLLKLILLFIFTAVICTGCRSDNSDIFNEYKAASTQTKKFFDTYYGSLNDFHRNIYFEEQKITKGQQIVCPRIIGSKDCCSECFNQCSNCETIYSVEEIKKWTDFVDAIVAYNNTLFQMFMKKSDLDKIAQKAEGIVKTIDNFYKCETYPQAANEVFTPSELSIKGATRRRQLDTATEKIVLIGYHPINNALNLAIQNVKEFKQKTLERACCRVLYLRVNRYNHCIACKELEKEKEGFCKLDSEKIFELGVIDNFAKRYEFIEKLDPTEVYCDMKKVNQALFNYVNSDHKNIGQLYESIRTLRNTVDKKNKAIKAFKRLEKASLNRL